MIEQAKAERLRSAYRAAVDALGELRSALEAAGILEATSSAVAVQAVDEPVEARRRRLKAERQRRWRERLAVDAGASTRPPAGASRERLRVDAGASTGASLERLPVDAGTSTDDAAGPRACARSSFSELSSPPVSSLSLGNIPPLTADGVSESPVEPTPPATIRSARRKGPARERPALRPGSTIDPSPESPAVPAVDRSPEAAGGDSVPTDVGRVWSVYAETVAPTRPRLTPSRADLIRRRLRDYTVDELERSIRGYGRSPFHRGENDRGRPYQALELWLRDAAHIEAGFHYLDGKGSSGKPTKKGAPELDGLSRDWQEYEARLEADRDVFADA